MITAKDYLELLDEIKGKTISIVYIYEGENAKGFGHYDIWKSNLISCWLNAIQELNCIPYIMDVRTFLFKSSNNTLPPIDYVINMNAGCINLSTLGLVPSVCGFLDKECIPCNTSAIIAGENKLLANRIAKSLDLKVPEDADLENLCIYRPLNFGSSKGIKLLNYKEISQKTNDGIYQEFIPGYDITTPFMYNPLSEKVEALPTIFYLPKQNTPSWYFDAESKETDKGFERIVLPNISNTLIEKNINLIKTINIDTYCRIDMRLKTNEKILHEKINDVKLTEENAFFIEINPMPTIEIGNNFYISYINIKENNSFYDVKTIYEKNIKNASAHGFILSCALIKKFISKH